MREGERWDVEKPLDGPLTEMDQYGRKADTPLKKVHETIQLYIIAIIQTKVLLHRCLCCSSNTSADCLPVRMVPHSNVHTFYTDWQRASFPLWKGEVTTHMKGRQDEDEEEGE